MTTLEDIINWNIPYLNVSVGDLIIALIITAIVAFVLLMVALRQIRRTMEKSKVPPLMGDLLVRIFRMIFGIATLFVFLSLVGFRPGGPLSALK